MERTAFRLPSLYPILDAGALDRAGIAIESIAVELHKFGIRFLQYRNKEGSDDLVLEHAHTLRKLFPAEEATLILNDRAHLVASAGFDGLHIGQEDLSPVQAREIIATHRILGFSTHNSTQLAAAARMPVDYIAIGPVFGTHSKDNPDPVIGLAGIREARRLTDKPLVAIGGIALLNVQSVFQAGADSIALISALLPSPGMSTGKLVEEFRSACRARY